MMEELLLKVLRKVLRNEALALPQRPRAMATKALESEEVKHLAKHIVKITLWPDISYCKGWEKEIRASLDNLAFKLCRYSNKVNKQRTVEKLWYGPQDIMKRLNEELDDADWAVMDEMEKESDNIVSDPFVGKNGKNFSQVGYTVKQETDKVKGIFFSFWKEGEKIV